MSTLRIIFKRRCCMRGVRLTCPVACGVCQASPHLALAGILTFCLCPFLFPSTCRRSPVTALPITSWPPQWCCGLQTNKTGSGTMNLGGSLTRQVWLCPAGCWQSQAVLPSLPHPAAPVRHKSIGFVRCCINTSSPAVLQPSEMVNAVCNYQKGPWTVLDTVELAIKNTERSAGVQTCL